MFAASRAKVSRRGAVGCCEKAGYTAHGGGARIGARAPVSPIVQSGQRCRAAAPPPTKDSKNQAVVSG